MWKNKKIKSPGLLKKFSEVCAYIDREGSKLTLMPDSKAIDGIFVTSDIGYSGEVIYQIGDLEEGIIKAAPVPQAFAHNGSINEITVLGNNCAEGVQARIEALHARYAIS